jgi:hypothetical protein
MFDVWKAGRDRTHCRWITRAAPYRKEAHGKETAADLEAPIVYVLVRHAITGKVRRKPQRNSGRSGMGSGAYRRTGCCMKGDDHPRVVADTSGFAPGVASMEMSRFVRTQ